MPNCNKCGLELYEAAEMSAGVVWFVVCVSAASGFLVGCGITWLLS